MAMKRIPEELRYSLYIPLHPFKGFWDLKHEGEGSFRTAMLILGTALAVAVGSAFFTEYLFNGENLKNYNFLTTILVGLGLFFGWCVSNWCFTCLNDGEGTFKDICTVTAYALVPYVLIQVLLIPLSYFLVLREASLYNLLMSLGYFWSGLLIVFGTLVVHQYSFSKTLLVCFVTIVGMAVLTYIGILLMNLLQVMIVFFTTLMDEIRITLR